MVTAYESIKNKLSATEIYDIKQGGLIDAEIRAYAVALQVVYDKVDVLLRECFVQTAEGYGLEQLESMARTYMNGDTLEIRRNKLMNRLQINPSIIGKDALKKQVASLGLECNITENIAESKARTQLAVTENLTRRQELSFLPQAQKLQLAQGAADIAFRYSQKNLTDKQARHEVEKLAETVVRANGQALQNQFDADTYDARAKSAGNESFRVFKGPLGDVFNALWSAVSDVKNRVF